jgi:hypothetical protein
MDLTRLILASIEWHGIMPHTTITREKNMIVIDFIKKVYPFPVYPAHTDSDFIITTRQKPNNK